MKSRVETEGKERTDIESILIYTLEEKILKVEHHYRVLRSGLV